MKVTFGKYKGKTVEYLMINQPDYIKWILTEHEPSGDLATIQNHVLKLIRKFDKKPFIGKSCSSSNCNNTATRFTINKENLTAYWWCDSCEPKHTDIPNDQLQSPIGYKSAIKHIDLYCNESISAYKTIIQMIATAKGLSSISELKMIMFFR